MVKIAENKLYFLNTTYNFANNSSNTLIFVIEFQPLS